MNADGQLNQSDGALGYNMFAYCNNNPVNMTDPSGRMPKWLKTAIVAVVAVAIIAVVAVASGGSALPIAIGAFIGAASSAAVNASVQHMTTGKIDPTQVIIAAASGGINGAFGGGDAPRNVLTIVGGATGLFQTAANDFVSETKSSPAAYAINAVTGGALNAIAGDGAQHHKPAGGGKITRYTKMDNFSIFDKSISSNFAIKSIVRGAGPGMAEDFVGTVASDEIIKIVND